MPYANDRAWSDQFMPSIKRIVGPRLLAVAPEEQDRLRNTDLWMLEGKNKRIACRVRRTSCIARRAEYGCQFTFRFRRDNGVETEWSKMLAGNGDWFFYGHARHDKLTGIMPWYLIDLDVFRECWGMCEAGDIRLEYGDTPNGDGTHFRWFSVHGFPDTHNILVDSTGYDGCPHGVSVIDSQEWLFA